MSMINGFHNEAMDLAELALIERLRGNLLREAELTRQALELELAAIRELKDPVEPTFSVLHRSAGTLALRCNDYRLAERIAAKALSEHPPDEIAEELRDLVEQIHFQRHLALRGIELGLDEVQMSLSGSCVGFGMVASDELVSRIGDASKLIGRIVERQRNLPFADRGLRQTTNESFPVLVSAPRAASFAVTLKVGRPMGQLQLPTEAQVVVDEFLDLMDLVGTSDMRALEERIPETPYLRNFLGIARKIAPDGERVRQVGFTVERRDGARQVSVTKPASEIPLPPVAESAAIDEASGTQVTIRGMLRFADATDGQTNEIKIIEDDGGRRTVQVPEGMMNDIVRPMWDARVVIYGLKRGRGRGRITLQDIKLDTNERASNLHSAPRGDDGAIHS